MFFLDFSGAEPGLASKYRHSQRAQPVFRFMGLTPLQFDLKYCYNGPCEGFK